jgi:acetolactate synthase-1/2/3 large subunit
MGRPQEIAAMARNAAELMIECLEAEGVRRIYGVPGEENLDLLEAIRRSWPPARVA